MEIYIISGFYFTVILSKIYSEVTFSNLKYSLLQFSGWAEIFGLENREVFAILRRFLIRGTGSGSQINIVARCAHL